MERLIGNDWQNYVAESMSERSVAQELETILPQVRTGARRFVTNFFPLPEELSLWIGRGLRVVASNERFVVLARPEKDCTRLFFSGSRSEMTSVLPMALQAVSKPCVVDLVGSSEANSDIANEFLDHGFTPYMCLSRLVRKNAFEFPNGGSFLSSCGSADPGNAVEILGYLRGSFDVYADQIPGEEEILRAIRNGQVRVLRLTEGLSGFLWFEKRGATSLIRYWWVSEDNRGRGIGSQLMRDYFSVTKDCTRHLLWLREDNRPAIACYRHYGYSPDGIQDHVMLLQG